MPRRPSLRVAFLGLALVASSTAYASDIKSDRMPASYMQLTKMAPMEVMHMIDTGAKGYLTREEFLRFQEQFFGQMDRNHDGRISEAEWTDRG
jgi:hypothetical protein